MKLVYFAALIAVCRAAHLDRTYLPPASAKTAGGSPGDIQTPLVRDVFNPGQDGLPKGAFDNEFEGVVVEAAAPGTRASSPGETGLGGDRISYGSTHSKVGGAAFKTNQQGFQIPNSQNTQHHTDQIESQTSQNFQGGPNLGFSTVSLRPQSEFEKASNIVRFENNVGSRAYNYAFETDNGITAEENGVAVNGIQAEGGYSYTGDDGKLYKVTYTAGEGGYQPSGDHLPTPPPIPEEILKSLEQNAREAAGGIVDDGSYDAAKYNAEDDHTESDSDNGRYNSGQPALGSTPESVGDISGTFINQNTRVFENLNGQQLPSTTPNDDTTKNNLFGSFQSSLQPTLATGLGNQPSSTAEPFDQINDGHTLNDFGTSESDKKYTSNLGDTFSINDDYSRPIYFGSMHLNQGTNNRFGIKQSYLPPTNNPISNNRQPVSFNFQNSVQNKLESSSFGLHGPSNNVNKPLVIAQSRPQSSSSNQYSLNSDSQNPQSQFINGEFSNNLNKNENIQSGIQGSYNTFNNNIQSTLQPSAELTTPFEDFPNLNKQPSNDNVPLNPTQPSFLGLPDSKSQSNNVPQITFGTSNKELNNNEFKVNTIASQQGFEQLSGTDFMKLSSGSQYQGPDHSYYYNLPSKPFNTNRVSTPTSASENILFNSGFNNGVVTKYPRPPTVAPTVASSLSNSMYNQYSNTPQTSSFASPNERYRPTTKYPQPSVVTHIVPSPTSPTERDNNKFPEQYTGITQASVSPFPSTSTKYSPSDIQSQNKGVSQDLPLNSQINTFNAFQKENTLIHPFNRDQANFHTSSQVGQQTSNQVKPELNNNAPQLSSSQQYNGEIYEYNKPAESLSTPSESDENSASTTRDDFSQFGQKLRPSSPSQSKQQNPQKESQANYNRGPQNQNNQPLIGTKPQLESTNLQGQFDQNKYTQGLSSSELFNQGFNNNKQQTNPSNNLHTIDRKPTFETTNLTPGAFIESRPTTDYKGPLSFSSRIRPCCQGPRTTSTGQDLRKEFRKPITSIQDQGSVNSGIPAQFGNQNANQKPGLVNENSFNTPSIVFNGPQTHGSQATSQSLPTGVGEIFGGPRRPPSFDEASGYHY